MSDFLTWLESSALGHAMRSSGVWTYGIVNLTHILGVATLFGSVLVLDLRMLGAWRNVPLHAIAQPTTRMASIGFVVAVISGTCLITTNATDYLGNPFLLIKFPAIAAGIANVALLSRLPAWKMRGTREPDWRQRRQLAAFGAISLLSWLMAVAAGRLIGYW